MAVAAIAAAVAAVTSTLRTEHAIVGEVYDDGPRPDRARGRIVCIAHHWIEREGEIRDLVCICATTTSTSAWVPTGVFGAGR